MDVSAQITAFVERELLSKAQAPRIGREDSLIASGLLDSLGIVELTGFVETTFGIRVADEEVIPANFESIEKLTEFVERKRIA